MPSEVNFQEVGRLSNLQHSETMKQQITLCLRKSKINEIFQKYDTEHFLKPSIHLHKNRRTCTIIFWLTDLHETKKRGNVRKSSIKKSRKYTS